MTRIRGRLKFRLWLWMRSKRICEDDRNPTISARWDETMARFFG